jgi:hypothetical protein
MFQFLKLHVLLHWFFIYIAVWIVEELVLRFAISWLFSPKVVTSETN